MSAAYKNECPVAAGQVVKTLSKHAIDFITILACIAAADARLTVAFTLDAFQTALIVLAGELL